MTSSQITLSNLTDVVCKLCRHLIQLEGRYYCNVFSAFLSDAVLSSPCDLQEAIKRK